MEEIALLREHCCTRLIKASEGSGGKKVVLSNLASSPPAKGTYFCMLTSGWEWINNRELLRRLDISFVRFRQEFEFNNSIRTWDKRGSKQQGSMLVCHHGVDV